MHAIGLLNACVNLACICSTRAAALTVPAAAALRQRVMEHSALQNSSLKIAGISLVTSASSVNKFTLMALT